VHAPTPSRREINEMSGLLCGPISSSYLITKFITGIYTMHVYIYFINPCVVPGCDRSSVLSMPFINPLGWMGHAFGAQCFLPVPAMASFMHFISASFSLCLHFTLLALLKKLFNAKCRFQFVHMTVQIFSSKRSPF